MALDTARRPVGITKGPGETTHEFTFVSRDDQQVLKNGEYVYYELEQGGSSYRVLGRIIKREPLQLFPDTFLAEPEISPTEMAALVGYDARANELFEMHVGIMGYYDTPLGSFVNPWIPPQSGKPIYIADSEMLAQVLSKRKKDSRGSGYIGSLLTRDPDEVPIVLDIKEMVSTHMAVIASTGAGKSYLASVIIEELMRPYNKACVLILDPHGEYNTLEQIPNNREFEEEDPRTRYKAKVQIYKPEHIKVRISSLNIGDMRYLLPELTEKQIYLLGESHREISSKFKGRPWSTQDLKNMIAEVGARGGENGGRDDSSTVGALEWKIGSRFENSFTFSDYEHLDLNQILQPGQCTVLQLNEIDERDQQVIVATLLRRLYKARLDTEKGKVHDGEFYLPYPVFVLIEEAHHFAPANADIVSSQVLKQVLAEGRKFGIGVGLISQRPGKLDQDVLSQCLTQFIMRIVNEVDQKSVATAVEGIGHDLLHNLPALSKGQVIVAGSAVNTPVLCRVRKRITPHGGESKDAPSEWLEYFSSARQEALKRDTSILVRDNKPFTGLR